MSKKVVFTCLGLIVLCTGLFAQLSSSAQDSEERERRVERRGDRPPEENRRAEDREAEEHRDRERAERGERERDERIRIERRQVRRERDEPRRDHEHGADALHHRLKDLNR